MKLSILMAACNQGDEVRKTVMSVQRALEVTDCDPEIIVFDDGSLDGCCHGLPQDVLVVIPRQRVGCPQARQKLAEMAGGDVLLWMDPHCRVPRDGIQRLVDAAIENDACVMAASRPWPRKRLVHGARFAMKSRRGLVCARNFTPGKDVNALYGTIYCIRSELYRKAGWMPLKGVYGNQELGFSLSLWFAGIPIVLLDDVVCWHKTRESYSPNGERFTYSHDDGDRIQNVIGVHYGWFAETWQDFWLPIFRRWRKHIDIDAVTGKMGKLRRWCDRRKKRTERALFEDVLGME